MVVDKYKQEDFIDFILVCSIQHGLSVDLTMLPTAVEKQGVYTWDEYGRFYYAGAGTAGAEEALRILKDYCATIKASRYDGAKQAALDDYWWDGDESPLNDYGWPKDKLPDFKGLQDEWNLKNLGAGVGSIEQPRSEDFLKGSGVRKVIAALFVKAFGVDKLADTQMDRNLNFGAVKEALERTGFSFTDKTLRKVIKDLPQPDEG